MDLTRKTSISDAIKIAQANKKELFTRDAASDLNEATQFVIAMDIKVGKIKVSNKVVYQAYSLWSGDPIKNHEFIEQFTSLFERHDNGGKATLKRYYYLLNYQPTELLREAVK